MSYDSDKYKPIMVHDEKQIKGFFEDWEFLSNFYPAPVWFQGILYPSTEAAYQAAKCVIIEDRHRFENLQPNKAKALGQVIPIRGDWERVKYDVMRDVVMQKFLWDINLRNRLLASGDRYLEETNYWGDRIWGVYKGVGTNWLGEILMGVRKFLTPIKPKERMRTSAFLEWVASSKPDPWSTMAANMQIFGVDNGSLNTLLQQFSVTLID